MKQFLIKHSNWSSLLLIIFLISCHRPLLTEKSIPEPFLNKEGTSLIYNADLNYKDDFHVSGLLIIKKLKEEAYHVVLLSKFGVTMMDFKLTSDGMEWIKSFEQLKKRNVEKLIEKDFRTLLLTPLYSPEAVRIKKETSEFKLLRVKNDQKIVVKVDKPDGKIIYSESKAFLNPVKAKVNFVYSEKEVPQKISLTHSNVKLSIQLNLLKIDHAQE